MRSLIACAAGCAAATALAQGPLQVALPGSALPQFVDRLPTLQGLDPRGTMATLVAPAAVEVHMREVRANVLPSTFVPPGGWPGGVPGTFVWSYVSGPAMPTANVDTYLGPVIVAQRGTPLPVQFVNDLGDTANSQLLFWKYATDQTLHWADPLGSGHQMTNYSGPIPAVAHLHGGEVPPQLDGGPDAWFTSDGAFRGHDYFTSNATDAPNSATYRYPNTQQAANLWFHDHTLGATRLNVYAGLAGAYVLTDAAAPANLPSPMVPFVIQDRQFDTNGQLFFPAVGVNMEHPFWVPEFVGDVICVNGKAWPFLDVEAKRYRFLFLNGSNARTYDMFLQATGSANVPMWVLGSDGGYLDAPALVGNGVRGATSLVMMPGERYEVIVDFSGLRPGTNVVLRNQAKMPFPNGTPPSAATTGRIAQFRVRAPVAGGDGYSPGTYVPPAALRGPGGAGTQPALTRLPGTIGGPAIAVGQNVQVVRQLTLNEVMGMGGPLEAIVNNTKWHGHSVASDVFMGGMRPDFAGMLGPNMVSEAPSEGDTEIWEVVNLTADAHPIHLHLVQFQLVDRQAFDVRRYQAAYDALFPGTAVIDPMTGLPFPPGAFVGGFGPPLPYDGSHPLSAGKLGGNPDVYARNLRGQPVYMKGVASRPRPWETGWKDTVVMNPGEVTRIAVRWAPSDLPLGTATPWFPFDPANGQGYVWHCHIVDHEDNEMMRPTSVMPAPVAAALRTFVLGFDY